MDEDGKNDCGIYKEQKLLVMGFSSFVMLMLVGVDGVYLKQRVALASFRPKEYFTWNRQGIPSVVGNFLYRAKALTDGAMPHGSRRPTGGELFRRRSLRGPIQEQ